MAPAIVVAYNKYMNSVDRFDQLRSTLKGVRKEQRLTSSIFSFIVDAAIQNSFSISKLIKGSNETRSLSDYKLDIALEMMQAGGTRMVNEDAEVVITGTREARSTVNAVTVMDEYAGASDATKKVLAGIGCNSCSTHQLVDLKPDKSGRCFMCALVNGQNASKSIYGCTGCMKPFHVSCFSIYHSDKFDRQHKDAVDIVKSAMIDTSRKRQFPKISTMVPTLFDEVIPTYKKPRKENLTLNRES